MLVYSRKLNVLGVLLIAACISFQFVRFRIAALLVGTAYGVPAESGKTIQSEVLWNFLSCILCVRSMQSHSYGELSSTTCSMLLSKPIVVTRCMFLKEPPESWVLVCSPFLSWPKSFYRPSTFQVHVFCGLLSKIPCPELIVSY